MKLDRYSEAGNYIETIDLRPGQHLVLPGKRTVHLGERISDAELSALNLYRVEAANPAHNALTQGVREIGRRIVDTPDGERSRVDLRVYDLSRSDVQTKMRERRAELARKIKREARRRIEEIAPAWRQRNWLADAIDSGDQAALRDHWAPIKAIRANAQALESRLPTMPNRDLPTFDPHDDKHWPA